MNTVVGQSGEFRGWVERTLGVACGCAQKASKNSFFVLSELCAGAMSASFALFALSMGQAKGTVLGWLVMSTLPLINAVCMRETCRTDLGLMFARVQILLMSIMAGLASPAAGFALLVAGVAREVVFKEQPKWFGLAALMSAAGLVVGYKTIGLYGADALELCAFGYFLGVMVGLGADLMTRPNLLPNVDLRQSSAQEDLQILQNSLPASVFVFEKNGDVVSQLGQELDLFETPLLGREMFSRVHVHERPLFLKTVADACEGLATATIAVRMRVDMQREQSVGGYEWFNVSLKRHATHAQAVGLVLNAQNDFEKIEALQEAKAVAEAASQAKGRFLGVMSHELRTPLNAIIGFADMLSQADAMGLGETQKNEYAHIIKNSGEHLLEIIESLLSVAKLESNSLELSVEPFAFEKVLHSALDMLQLRFDNAKLSVSHRIDPLLDEVVGDPRAVRQILINLLSNAIKFTPEGGKIQIHARKIDDKFMLSVQDSGCGIDADDVVRLGQPFFQASSGHARAAEGTGLGLAIVKGLANLHGGGFSVESKRGEGSTFSVWLPSEKQEKQKPTGTENILNIAPRWGDDETYKKLKEKKRA